MRPSLPTRVPNVIDALIAILADSPDLVGVQIIDGPVRDRAEMDADVIVIAPSTPDDPGVMSTYEQEPGLGNAYVEVVEIGFVISSWSGEESIKLHRDRVAELLGAMQSAIGGNRTRADAWDSIAMGGQSQWHQVQHRDGATVALGSTLVTKAII